MIRLASNEALSTAIARLPEFESRLNGYRPEMIDHPSIGWCLRNYLVLTEFPELLCQEGLSPPEVFWSRYYWLLRFTRAWSQVVGFDAGLEQQMFKLLESAPDGLDALSEVEGAVEGVVSDRLA